MKKRFLLVTGGLAVAAIAFAAGVLATFAYLAQPFEEWRTEFNEVFMTSQVDALNALRHGESEPAVKYLEGVAAMSLRDLAEQKSKGAKVPSSAGTARSIVYLCATSAGAASSPASLKQSCAILRNGSR